MSSPPEFSLEPLFRNMPVLSRFLVIEGVDASGKSTQIARLREFFRQQEMKHWHTREPTHGPLGRYIRQQLSSSSVDEAEIAALLAVDRAEHLYRDGEATREGGIVSLCRQGWWCLCDRYFFSSFSYQGGILGDEYVWQLNQTFPLPAWVFFLYIPEEQIASRLRQRGGAPQIYERCETLRNVQRRYQNIFRQLPLHKVHFHQIDASQPIETTSRQIVDVLAARCDHNLFK